METSTLQRAVLLADITGSTTLYENAGDDAAARQIGQGIDWMKDIVEHGDGVFVAAKGDDILATFEAAERALNAIEVILRSLDWGDLAIHAGLHFGPIIVTRDDIFGDTVNVTSRLSSLANPGEVLMSGDFVAQLDNQRAASLKSLNAMRIKGKAEPIAVYSLNSDTVMLQTELAPQVAMAQPPVTVRVKLCLGDQEILLQEGSSITVGRSPDNHFHIARPFVSRRHATLEIANGRVQLSDHSSFGSYLTVEGNVEIFTRRETLPIVGSGHLSPGVSAQDPDAQLIHFVIDVD